MPTNKITVQSGTIGIADSPFYSNETALTSITFPDGLLYIGEQACKGCTNLTSAVVPNSVMRIGRFAFNGCSKLASINIPTSLTVIEEYSFGNCSKLTSISIPEGVLEIQASAFFGCPLSSIIIPSSVTTIGKNALWNTVSSSIYFLGDLPDIQDGISHGASGIWVPLRYMNNYKTSFGTTSLYPMLESGTKRYRTFSFHNTLGFDMNGTVKGLYDQSKTLAIKYVSAASLSNHTVTLSTAWGNWQVNEGFLIVGEGEPGEYYPIQRSTGTLSSHTNLLKGSGANGIDFDPLVAAQGSNLRYFILSDGDFYPVSGGTLAPYKSYLDLGENISSSAAFTFIFDDDEPTGVQGVTVRETTTADDSYYDLSGRKVSSNALRKGIYIHNGRKEVIK